jgi:hypothetical protein
MPCVRAFLMASATASAHAGNANPFSASIRHAAGFSLTIRGTAFPFARPFFK